MDLQRTKYDPARFTFGTFLSQAEGNVFQEGDRERYRNEDPWIMKKKDEVDWEVEAEEEHEAILTRRLPVARNPGVWGVWSAGVRLTLEEAREYRGGSGPG